MFFKSNLEHIHSRQKLTFQSPHSEAYIGDTIPMIDVEWPMCQSACPFLLPVLHPRLSFQPKTHFPRISLLPKL